MHKWLLLKWAPIILRKLQDIVNIPCQPMGSLPICGKAHLEGFGSMENVKKGKGELFEYLRNHDGTAFVNADDDAVVELSKGISNVIFYGNEDNGVHGKITQE